MDIAHSIMQYYGHRRSNRCGYCQKKPANKENHGMWAHQLTVDDYQGLINRNWRRSGLYCYHPIMDSTCCPLYMIRCDALNFRIGKHQKKLIKRVNRYLATGLTSDVQDTEVKGQGRSSITSVSPRESPVGSCDSTKPSDSNVKGLKQIRPGDGADPDKPKAVKAKLLRKQKKTEKLQKMGELLEVKEKKMNIAKSLEELLAEYDQESSKHRLELRLVRSNPPSEEFLRTQKEEHELYKRYQVAIHKDDEEKVDMSQFKRFLIDSPMPPENRSDVELGSFHYQYILDGKIIAVEVMDVLPECISSKYFIYDPEYHFLTLGTYSTLRSIQLVNDLHKQLPSIKYYLMGYYIHNCPKMRYKGQFSPSYLLCPETYRWIELEKCIPKLDVSKYSRLCEDTVIGDVDRPNSEEIKSTKCLYRRQIVPYEILRAIRRGDGDDDLDEVTEYCQLVGKALATSLLLYRPH